MDIYSLLNNTVYTGESWSAGLAECYKAALCTIPLDLTSRWWFAADRMNCRVCSADWRCLWIFQERSIKISNTDTDVLFWQFAWRKLQKLSSGKLYPTLISNCIPSIKCSDIHRAAVFSSMNVAMSVQTGIASRTTWHSKGPGFNFDLETSQPAVALNPFRQMPAQYHILGKNTVCHILSSSLFTYLTTMCHYINCK